MTGKVILVFLFRFTGVFLSFILNIYLSRVLEKEILGVYFWLLQVLMIASTFLKGGVDLSTLKYGSIVSKQETKNIAAKYTILILIPTICIVIAGLVLSNQLENQARVTEINFILITLVPFTLFNIISELQKSRGNQILGTVIQACLLPILIFLIYYITSITILTSYIYAVIVLMLVSFLSILFINSTSKSNQDSFDEKNFWVDAKSFLSISLLNIIMSSMDIIMIGFFKNPTLVAEYAIAYKIVTLSSIFLIVINGLIGPIFASLWAKKNIDKLISIFLKVTLVMLFLSLCMLLFFILMGEYLLTTLYGIEYSRSYSIMMILAIGQATVLGTGPVAYLLMMTDSKQAYKKTLILAVLINFILNLALIPLYGALGAAIATAIGLLAKNISGLIVANKEFGIFSLRIKHG